MSNYQHERGWLDSDVWGDAPYSEREAWSWMIGEANWKDGQKNIGGYPVMVLRGQFSSSLRFMATKFKWQKNKVDRYLKKLVLWGMIEIGTSNGTGQNIITICNYNEYQKKNGKNGTEIGTETGQERDRSGTGAGQTRNPSIQSNPSNHIIDMSVESYNMMAKEKNLPNVVKLTPDRKKKLKAILDEHGIDGWNNCIKKISLSKFMQGENDTRWRVSFDFVIIENNFLKIIEGKYDNNEKPVKKFTGF